MVGRVDRRSFVQGAGALAVTAGMLPEAAAATALKVAEEARAARQMAASHESAPVRVGVIGAGSRGKELVRNLLRVPGVRVVAAADVYAPRFAELNAVCGYPIAEHADYRAMLQRRDVDAVVVATPLGLHAEQVLASLASGRAVYAEKTLAYTVEEARAVRDAAAMKGALLQVGHQYRYSPWIRAAVARVQAGEIGEVTHILGYWNRNNDWRRPVPAVDPGGSLERLINWRLYHQWSLGLIAELGSHHMDLANWIFGGTPVAALGSGSICRYHDGRETDDNVQVVLSYAGGRRCIFTSMTDNAKMGDQLWVYGTKGSLNLTLIDATFFYEPAAVQRVATATETGVVTSASYQPGGEMPYRGPGLPVEVKDPEDATTIATRAFVHCVRTGERPVADAVVGYGAALCVVQADRARQERREVAIPAEV